MKASDVTYAAIEATFTRREPIADEPLKRCVTCNAGLFPESPNIRCLECLEERAKRARTYRYRRKDRIYRKKRYANDETYRVEKLTTNQQYREDRAEQGLCRNCPELSLDDSYFCKTCRDIVNKQKIESFARKAAKGKCKRCQKKATHPLKSKVPYLCGPHYETVLQENRESTKRYRLKKKKANG